MSRSQKRAVVRGSLLLDLVTRDLLSDRQKAAALMLERDREQASGVSASICAYGASTGGGGAKAPIARETFASQSWEALKRSLSPSDRKLLGSIEAVNATKRGNLSAVPIRTKIRDEASASIFKRGIIAMFLERVADHYRLPEEA